MVRYLVAVSGGIDSVVLLDMLARQGKHELIVAHFDHGIRPDSAADARFVEALTKTYRLPYVQRREELGEHASEDYARERRYAFLKAEAKKHDAQLVTAHHGGDAIETVALNIQRGTGWRGLAVLDSLDISRPLLGFSKEQLYKYALKRRLEWVEDSTNASDAYARNRLRRRIARLLSETDKEAILELRRQQVETKDAIDTEVMKVLLPQGTQYSRYFFITIPTVAATELLRAIAIETTGHSLPRPQLQRALLMIKTARAGTLFAFGSTWIVFGVKTFSIPVKTP